MEYKLLFILIFEAMVIAASVSLDSFVAGFAYGSNKIKVPFLSVQIINTICSVMLGISLWIGSLVREFLPSWLTITISFGILFILGVQKLLDSVTKSLIRKHDKLKKDFSFSLLNFKFILTLYADPEKADVDKSKILSKKECVSIAIALSLDGIAIGFGAALASVNTLAVFICSFITGTLAIMLGSHIGNKVAKKIPFNISWISGAILIILAFTKLI